MVKYYFYTKEGAELFQKACKNCYTRKYYADGIWYIIIGKQLNWLGQYKTPIIPELNIDGICFNAYQNSIKELRTILLHGNKIEQVKTAKLILTISEMQINNHMR